MSSGVVILGFMFPSLSIVCFLHQIASPMRFHSHLSWEGGENASLALVYYGKWSAATDSAIGEGWEWKNCRSQEAPLYYFGPSYFDHGLSNGQSVWAEWLNFFWIRKANWKSIFCQREMVFLLALSGRATLAWCLAELGFKKGLGLRLPFSAILVGLPV